MSQNTEQYAKSTGKSIRTARNHAARSDKAYKDTKGNIKWKVENPNIDLTTIPDDEIPDKEISTKRKEYFAAKKAELEYKKSLLDVNMMMDNMVDKKEIENKFGNLINSLRDNILNVPILLQQELGGELDHKTKTILDRIIRENWDKAIT